MFLGLKRTLEYVSGPGATHCLGLVLRLFPFLRNRGLREEALQCSVVKFFNVASWVLVFSHWTLSSDALGDGYSYV